VRFRARAAAAVVALPLILGVAACGADDLSIDGGGSKPAAAKPTAAPLKAPARLTNASFLPAMNAATAKARSMESVVRYSADGQVVTMTMAQTLKPLAMKMEMSNPALGGAVHIVVIKTTIYLAAPAVAPGGKYVKLNLRGSKDPALAALADMLENADPLKSFASWDKALRKVKFVKSETIGFRKVDRYQVTVDSAVAFGLKAKQVSALGLPKLMVYSMWLGADHLPYKMAYKTGGMDTQITMSSYNATGTITAPPANKIVTR
jgi:hypothetical protein